MLNEWHQAGLGAAAVLLTGAVSWWAGYVTRGASKALKHETELMEMRESIEEHERREEREFSEVRSEIGGMRADIQGLVGDVGEMRGELAAISKFIRNGRP